MLWDGMTDDAVDRRRQTKGGEGRRREERVQDDVTIIILLARVARGIMIINEGIVNLHHHYNTFAVSVS